MQEDNKEIKCLKGMSSAEINLRLDRILLICYNKFTQYNSKEDKFMGGILGGCSSLIASASAVMVGISMLLASFVAFKKKK